MKFLILPLLLALVSGAEYQPGTPGGAWSQDDLMVVRAKLWRLYGQEKGSPYPYTLPDNFFDKFGLPPSNDFEDLQHFAAKVVRLSFHDCVRYKSKQGGCDGCLNWHGVGHRFPGLGNQEALKYKFLEDMDDLKETNNNGLEHTVAVLEELYTNKNFPNGAMKLTKSLKETGKSRADLWAYAGKVAVEFTTEQNNFQCAGMPANWMNKSPYNFGSLTAANAGMMYDCLTWRYGEADCEAALPREIQFQFGRADCVSEYDGKWEQFKTDRPETHPNPEGNGDATLDFFRDQFSFNGRETAAIMGAHTLGRMQMSHSLFKYTWTVRGGHLFNNAYYKNIVRKTDWFIESQDGKTCSLVGDAQGNLPDTKWVPTMNGFTKSGGPMHWIRMHYACTYCGHRPVPTSSHSGKFIRHYDKCCPGRPEGLACKPDNVTHSAQTLNPVDDIDKGCEKYRFAFGADESLINAEAGLYFKFDEENGIPKNCPGLEHFNMENWTSGDKKWMTKNTVRRAFEMECPLQDRKLPSTDKAVSEIITDYATNQQLWLGDFIGAFEKMTSNGYMDGDLTAAPASWQNVQCKNLNKVMTCLQA